MKIAKYRFVLCVLCFCCFLMIGCDSLSDPSKPELDPAALQTGGVGQEGLAEGESASSTGFCRGGELLCLPAMTSELVKKAGGKVLGGSYTSSGTFKSSSKGGISFPLRINTSQPLHIEFEIKNNIPNWRKGETSGGKVSLVTLDQRGGNYYFSLQRMYRSYRGGGVFRAILADRPDPLEQGAAFLITTSSLAGHYSMAKWGNEPHRFEITIKGNSCQLDIDSYHSGTSSAPYSIRGTKNVTFILGNREIERLGMGQGAQTTFVNLKVTN